jgi:predicted nuclease of predicted toxin-antitoxin system
MRIVLDENLPIKLKVELGSEHEVFSVRQLGWTGKKNGELLQLMISKQIELLITLDKNLVHQNKISVLPLSVIILNAKNSKIETLIPFIQKLNNLMEMKIKMGEVLIVDL